MSAMRQCAGRQVSSRAATMARPTPVGRVHLQVSARATKTSNEQYTVNIDKPTGLQLEQSDSEGGGLRVKSASGNAAKAGVKSGDTVIYASSFFGDELWPADKLSLVLNALKAAPSPITITCVKGENTSVNVKRLAKKEAPAKLYNRKLTDGQRELATHVCVDCGYVYAEKVPFEKVSESYRCPQCLAPKRRFVPYDVRSGKVRKRLWPVDKAKGMAAGTIGTTATLIGGLVGVAVLAYLASTV